jgi:hypothetical protein
MSWHHGDWLAFAQAIAGVLAVVGAFGVVFLQHWIQASHARRTAGLERLRDRYRASTYVEALIENAIACAGNALNSIEAFAKVNDENGHASFVSPRLDKAAEALGQAIHNQLPTEITRAVLSAWMASQSFSHALHRTEKVRVMKMSELKTHCGEQFSVLNYSLEAVRLSKIKWETRLADK